MRQLCRDVGLDPSFFSKVLAGKRSPPMEEAMLRRIAVALEVDAAELIVAAGRIPEEWSGVWRDRDLFDRVNVLATGKESNSARPRPTRAPAVAKPPFSARFIPAARHLSEELL